MLSGWEQPQLQDALGESMSGGSARGQQVWHHASISSGARDCDLGQVTLPAVKVQTPLCKEELGCFNPFRNKGLHAFKYWINHYLDYFFPYIKWILYPRTMKIHKAHCYKILHS